MKYVMLGSAVCQVLLSNALTMLHSNGSSSSNTNNSNNNIIAAAASRRVDDMRSEASLKNIYMKSIEICCPSAVRRHNTSVRQVRTLNSRNRRPQLQLVSVAVPVGIPPFSCHVEIVGRGARFTLFLSCSPSLRLLFVVKVSGIWLGLVCFWDSFY